MKLRFKLNRFFQNKTNVFIVVLVVFGIVIAGYGLIKKYMKPPNPTPEKVSSIEKTASATAASEVTTISSDELATALTKNSKQYLNKKVSISAIQANINPEGRFLELKGNSENGTAVWIECYVMEDALRQQLRDLDPTAGITLEGTVVSSDPTHYAIMVSKLTGKKHEVAYSVRVESQPNNGKKYILQADGKDDPSFTGLCNVLMTDFNPSEDWYFFNGGVLDTVATGLYKKEDTLVYVTGGKQNMSFNGIAAGSDGNNYLVINGAVATDYSGKYMNADGTTVSVINGTVQN